MVLLDGKAVSRERNMDLKDQIDRMFLTYRKNPKLAIILIGNNPASMSYVKGKKKACQLVGIENEMHYLPENTTHETLENLIKTLNKQDDVHGILLQLPIPKHLDEDYFVDLIAKDKDADGFHVVNQGKLYQKKKTILPATPKGIMTLLDHYNIDLVGKNAVVIGRSNIVGFPVARLLMDRGATITVCHSKTKDLKSHTLNADIIVAAVGRPKLLTAEMVKAGAVVVDVGVNRVDGKLVGDVDFEGLKEKCSYLTPVPGGVGPMTIHSLLENTFELFLQYVSKKR